MKMGKCGRMMLESRFRLMAVASFLSLIHISLWKSGTIALTVCAVFACINSLSRAISVMIALHMQLPQDEPWFCLAACVFYNVVCWILVLTAFYPSTHAAVSYTHLDVYKRQGESTGRPASAAAGSGICRVFRERSQYAEIGRASCRERV